MNMQITPYAITLLSSVFVGLIIALVAAKWRGLPTNIIGYSLFLNSVLIIFGTKTYMVILSGFQKTILNSGFSSIGAVSGLVLGTFTMGLIYPEGRRELYESYVLSAPIMYSISKIGCHIAGCCHGIAYEGPFAITYHTSPIKSGPYFPVQLVESIVFFIIFLIAIYLLFIRKSAYMFPITMIVGAVSKGLLELLREEYTGAHISATQIFCIIGIGIGIFATILTNRTKRTGYKCSNDR